MTLVIAGVSLAAAGCAAALAYARAGVRAEYAVAKVVASLGFVLVAIGSGAALGGWTRIALVALAVSAAGDAVLATPGERGLLGGLGLFAVAHAVYVAAFVLRGVHLPVLAITTVAAVAIGAVVWTVLGPRLSGRMRVPVAAYLTLVCAMLAAGTASALEGGAWALAAGVVLVAGSDVAVARERFVAPGFTNKVVGLPAYYAGQLLIALSLTVV